MSPCARGCCWTAFQVCSRQRVCRCHWDEKRPQGLAGNAATHRDPTSQQAIRNVMRERNQK